ncbi:MAG: hypothetical protein MK052_03120 [Alphaproteobacteria bacterium]|nr:hypothetical protein [Alphaproteobacteria bacterium]
MRIARHRMDNDNSSRNWIPLIIALVIMALVAGAVIFNRDQTTTPEPPAPTPTATAPSPTTPAPAPTQPPTPSPTTAPPTEEPPPATDLPLTGIVNGECMLTNDGLGHVCITGEELNFNRFGLAFLTDPFELIVVTCNSSSCVSRVGTPQDVPCVQSGSDMFCVSVKDDDLRPALFNAMSQFASNCTNDRTRGLICNVPPNWEIVDGSPVFNDIPLVLTQQLATIIVYAGHAASSAQNVYTCETSDTAGQLICND